MVCPFLTYRGRKMRHIVRISSLFFVFAFVVQTTMAYAQSTCSVPIESFITSVTGEPLNTSIDVELNFYLSGDEDALAVDCRVARDVPVSEGWMRLIIDACSLPPDDGSGCGTSTLENLFVASDETGDAVHVGVRIGDDPDELSPRFSIGAVPFAIRSAHAAHAEDATTLNGVTADGFLRSDVPVDASTLSGLTSEEIITTTIEDITSEAAGWSSGGGGGCVTLYNEDVCPADTTVMLGGGQTVIIGSNSGDGGFGAPACIDTEGLGDLDGSSSWVDNRIFLMGEDAEFWSEEELPCVICCTGGSGGGGSTGGTIRFHGITSVSRLGDAGRPQMNADCHAEYPGTRMCRMSDLEAMYPAPVPGEEGRVLQSIASMNYGHNLFPDGSVQIWEDENINCNPDEATNRFQASFSSSSSDYTQALITEDGGYRNAWCNVSYPTACCGP